MAHTCLSAFGQSCFLYPSAFFFFLEHFKVNLRYICKTITIWPCTWNIECHSGDGTLGMSQKHRWSHKEEGEAGLLAAALKSLCSVWKTQRQERRDLAPGNSEWHEKEHHQLLPRLGLEKLLKTWGVREDCVASWQREFQLVCPPVWSSLARQLLFL